MDGEEQERRGEDARRIIEAPIHREAFAALEERLVNELARQDIDPQRAEFLRLLLVAGRKYRLYIEQVMVTGTMAAMETQRKRSLSDRMFRRS